MLRKTLTGNDNYPIQDSHTLSSPIQMELYLKPTIFPDIFFSFLESTSNFKHSEKKDDRHTYLISEITECEKHGYTSL